MTLILRCYKHPSFQRKIYNSYRKKLFNILNRKKKKKTNYVSISKHFSLLLVITHQNQNVHDTYHSQYITILYYIAIPLNFF